MIFIIICLKECAVNVIHMIIICSPKKVALAHGRCMDFVLSGSSKLEERLLLVGKEVRFANQ